MNIDTMLEVLNGVHDKLITMDSNSTEWKYYDGLKAMATVAVGKPICIDSTGHHYIYNA